MEETIEISPAVSIDVDSFPFPDGLCPANPATLEAQKAETESALRDNIALYGSLKEIFERETRELLALHAEAKRKAEDAVRNEASEQERRAIGAELIRVAEALRNQKERNCQQAPLYCKLRNSFLSVLAVRHGVALERAAQDDDSSARMLASFHYPLNLHVRADAGPLERCSACDSPDWNVHVERSCALLAEERRVACDCAPPRCYRCALPGLLASLENNLEAAYYGGAPSCLIPCATCGGQLCLFEMRNATQPELCLSDMDLAFLQPASDAEKRAPIDFLRDAAANHGLCLPAAEETADPVQHVRKMIALRVDASPLPCTACGDSRDVRIVAETSCPWLTSEGSTFARCECPSDPFPCCLNCLSPSLSLLLENNTGQDEHDSQPFCLVGCPTCQGAICPYDVRSISQTQATRGCVCAQLKAPLLALLHGNARPPATAPRPTSSLRGKSKKSYSCGLCDAPGNHYAPTCPHNTGKEKAAPRKRKRKRSSSKTAPGASLVADGAHV